MPNDFIAALKAEIDVISDVLERDLRYIRLRELKKILALYDHAAHEDTPTETRRGAGRRPSPEREQALGLVKRFLVTRGTPVPTRDILEHLMAKGVSISGGAPLNYLSAMLSNSGDFFSNGRFGWALRNKTLAGVADEYVASLTADVLARLIKAWEENKGLNPELDGKMLASARSSLGRDLTELERVDLRTHFIEIAKSTLNKS